MQQTTFIINPVSGFGKTKRKLKEIVKEIQEIDPKAKVLLTHHRMHAIALTKDAIIRGADRVVAVGGDGTLNEVVNGYFANDGTPHNPKASIAVVPSGLGSDFYRCIGNGRDLKDAIHFALKGEAKPTDVGQVTAQDDHGAEITRYFINISSLGLSGLASAMIKNMPKKLPPSITYFIAAMRAIGQFKPTTILLTEGSKQQRIEDCSLVSFANGQFFGSGMKIAPGATLDDGLFNVLTAQNLTLSFFMLNAHRLYQGTHLDLDNINEWKKSHCLVETLSSDPVYIECDGEIFAHLPAEFSIKPKALLLVRA